MIIIMSRTASKEQVVRSKNNCAVRDLDPSVAGRGRTIIGAIGDRSPELMPMVAAMAGVERVVPILKPFKLASRDFKSDSTRVKVGRRSLVGRKQY